MHWNAVEAMDKQRNSIITCRWWCKNMRLP